jgi:uncharacterized membrane protein YkoI
MPTLRVLTFTILTTIALAAVPALAAKNAAEEAQEKTVQLSQVPKAAVDAAQKALGGKVTEAKVMQQDGQQVYELERKDASGKERAVHVTAGGQILKTEEGSD